MLVQIAHRGCGVFILGDIQHPTGHSPKQPVAGNSALSREGWLRQSRVVLSNLGAYGKHLGAYFQCWCLWEDKMCVEKSHS